MEKQVLTNLINELFKPLGFKKKGNNWIHTSEELIKIIDLQKSNFSRMYYLNYNFKIKGYQDTAMKADVFHRLFSKDFPHLFTIGQLLDIDFEINNNDRIYQLKMLITKQIIPLFKSVNTEKELAAYLMSLPDMNMVPMGVKKYLKLQ